jgi:dienelactone hydrolase
MRSRPLLLLSSVVVLALVAAGCSDAPSGSNAPLDLATLAAPGPYAVGEATLQLVDTSRPTAANGSYPGAPDRTLPTRVLYPAEADGAGAPPSGDGPFPIIGWAHGYSSANFEIEFVGRHLASHGYVVVAPTFPLSNGGAPGGPTIADMTNQPGDVDFVMRQVQDGAAGAALAAAVDSGRRGIAGLSLGGGTVLIAAYHPKWRIEDIAAAVALAPASCFFGADLYARSLPTVILSGDADMLVRTASGPLQAFQDAPAPSTLVTLSGGNHVGFIGIDAPPGSANADATVGCPVIGAGGSLAASGFATLSQLLEEGAGPGAVDGSTCTVGVCDEVLPQTMTAERQLEITRAVALAHFDAVLRGDRAAGRWLERDLATQASDVSVAIRR